MGLESFVGLVVVCFYMDTFYCETKKQLGRVFWFWSWVLLQTIARRVGNYCVSQEREIWQLGMKALLGPEEIIQLRGGTVGNCTLPGITRGKIIISVLISLGCTNSPRCYKKDDSPIIITLMIPYELAMKGKPCILRARCLEYLSINEDDYIAGIMWHGSERVGACKRGA